MWGRRLVFLLALALVCVAGMCFVPSGRAPFSVVHGPATAFRAKQAFLLLTITVLNALKHVVTLISADWLARLCLRPAFDVLLPASDLASLSCTLRC
jgi:hypothetical protein